MSTTSPTTTWHSMVDTAHSSRRQAAVALIGVLLFAWLGAPTLADLWHRWFPAWDQTGASWSHRLLGGDSYFAHGPLGLFAAVVLAITVWRRGGCGERRGRRLGWCVLVAAMLLHGLARWADVMFIAACAMLAAAAGAAMATGGWATLRRYGWALAVAALAIPWPMVGVARLNLALKELAIDAAAGIAGPLVAGSITQAGSYVLLMDAGAAEPSALLIGSVCSGLRGLAAILFTAVLFAAVCRLRGWRSVLLIAAALPLAMLLNIARVAVLVAGASWWGVAVASEGGWLHDWSGPVMFLGALGLLSLLESMLHRPVAGGLTRGLVRGDARPTPRATWALTGLLVIAAAWHAWFNHGDRADPAAAGPRLLMPGAAIEIDGALLTAQTVGLDDKTRRWLASGRWCYERFSPIGRTAAAPLPIDLLIVEAGRRRDLLHPPEVCLAGRGDELLHRVARSGPDGRTVVELLTQRGRMRELHVFVYQHGSTWTTSFLMQHLRMMMPARAGAEGRLIRLSMPLDTESGTIDAARRRLDAALAAVTRMLDRDDAAAQRLAQR